MPACDSLRRSDPVVDCMQTVTSMLRRTTPTRSSRRTILGRSCVARRVIPLAFLLPAACDEITPPKKGAVDEPQGSIYDGARSGNPNFFFLPPMVRQPTYAGTADGDQPVNVVICEWNATSGACDNVVAAFSRAEGTGSEAVRYDAAAEQYVVNWHTDTCISQLCSVDPAKTYRL